MEGGEHSYKFINIKGAPSYQPNNLTVTKGHFAFARNIDSQHKVVIYDKALVEREEQKGYTEVSKDLTYISLLKFVQFNDKTYLIVGCSNQCQIKDEKGSRTEGLIQVTGDDFTAKPAQFLSTCVVKCKDGAQLILAGTSRGTLYSMNKRFDNSMFHSMED